MESIILLVYLVTISHEFLSSILRQRLTNAEPRHGQYSRDPSHSIQTEQSFYELIQQQECGAGGEG